MLVEGRIELSRREKHADRVSRRAAWGDRAKRRKQRVGIVLDRRHAVLGEQLREQPHHHFPVLQHVGDAGGRARIVLEDVEVVGVDADDVDAGDVDVDVVGNAAPVHLGPEARVPEDQVLRHDAGLQAFALAVDVGEEGVQRIHALGEPLLQDLPFGLGDDTGDDVERDQPFGGLGIAIDGEGDADSAEEQLGLAAPKRDVICRHRVQPALQGDVSIPDTVAFGTHFVERCDHSCPLNQAMRSRIAKSRLTANRVPVKHG